jgi:hypothetical protein
MGQPTNRSSLGFEAQTEKFEATGFETKPGEIVSMVLMPNH